MSPRTGRPVKRDYRVQELKTFTMRLPEEKLDLLVGLGEVTGEPAYLLLGRLFDSHFKLQPPRVRAAAAAAGRRRRAAAKAASKKS